jgi:hypothetical protein
MRTDAHMIAAAHLECHRRSDRQEGARLDAAATTRATGPLGTADNAVVVLKQHESRERTLIAATIFSSYNSDHDSG